MANLLERRTGYDTVPQIQGARPGGAGDGGSSGVGDGVFSGGLGGD